MTTTVTLDYKPVINTSQELFEGICQENPELRL
ncbi:MAG: Uma2 family endonuclease, partial [Prochloron sp. SP5CPC1]|nr:Uma2 family endonuclease [Candidatus Paraprochloron terpiosi SP5CPC1]